MTLNHVSPFAPTLAFALLLGGPLYPQQGTSQEPGWRHLPTPSISRAHPRILRHQAPLGSHLVLKNEAQSAAAAAESSRLPFANLVDLLEGDARRAGQVLTIHRPGPPLIAHGDAETLDRAARTVSALDALGTGQIIQLSAWLAPVAPPASAEAPRVIFAPGELSIPEADGAANYSAQLRSGDSVSFGHRQEDSFLADFNVEVAQLSGVADPAFGRAITGQEVFVRAWRLQRGESLFLCGYLDLAWPEPSGSFDPHAPELGRIEQPRVRFAQVCFSGRLENGGALRVVLRDLPAPLPSQCTLILQARTSPDPSDNPWRSRDVAFLDTEVAKLEFPTPGAGVGDVGPTQHRAPSERFSAASIWGESKRTRSGENSRLPLLAYAPGILVGPADSAELWSSVDTLVSAAEIGRSQTRALRVQCGSFAAELPVSNFATSRVWSGLETTALVDYEVELAVEAWMPDPVVRPVVDGFIVQGWLAADAFTASVWRASSLSPNSAGQVDTTHGRVSLLRRVFAGAEQTVATGAGPQTLMAATPSQASDIYTGELRALLARP